MFGQFSSLRSHVSVVQHVMPFFFGQFSHCLPSKYSNTLDRTRECHYAASVILALFLQTLQAYQMSGLSITKYLRKTNCIKSRATKKNPYLCSFIALFSSQAFKCIKNRRNITSTFQDIVHDRWPLAKKIGSQKTRGEVEKHKWNGSFRQLQKAIAL